MSFLEIKVRVAHFDPVRSKRKIFVLICSTKFASARSLSILICNAQSHPLLLHPAHVVPTSEIAALIDDHKLLQCVRADDRLSSDLQHRQLVPFHQLPHCVPPDSRYFSSLVNGHTQFYNADCPVPPFFVAICNSTICIIQADVLFVKSISQLILKSL